MAEAAGANQMDDARKQQILAKFKKAVITATRKKRLAKLIEMKRAELAASGKADQKGDDDSPFVPCDDRAIDKFLAITRPTPDDLVVDLGCGDARLLVAAAKSARCKCIGVEIQPAVAAKARQKVITILHMCIFWYNMLLILLTRSKRAE